MDLIENWTAIRKHFSHSFGSSLHVSIASVDANNAPTVTPVGTVFLNKDQTGFYFEKFVSTLPKHVAHNNQICILAVNSGKFFWLKSLFKARFDAYPAYRLYGTLGQRREATQAEIRALERRMKLTRSLKGHKYLWNDMTKVREIRFNRGEQINIGKMTQKL
ncbi:MAG: pyridoxamine 5'-phosphate oxidase family protein [Arenibacter sp.]|nr:pyridoxamine 5'-phosphate oxidase family protein [Maribacter sp.]NNG10235.1 pyridoxamine 5'-phosphate oxidase family protein [Arenibacter sp.]